MARLSINELKARFATADQPTQKDFADFIDTMIGQIQASSSNPLPGGAYYYATATLSGNTYTAGYSPTITSYLDGTILAFKANVENPAGSILFDAGNGAIEILKQGGLSLERGDIQAHQIVELRFNGTNSKWQVISPLYRSNGRAGDIVISGAPLAGDATAASGATRLICDGGSYLRANYPDLYSAIGTTFGSADGTHFNVPDMRRQVPIGVGPSGLAPAGPPAPVNINLGTRLGEEIHKVFFNEMPPHFHGVGTVQFDGDDETTVAFVKRNWTAESEQEWMSSGDGGRNMLRVLDKSTGDTASTNACNPGGFADAHNNLQPGVGLYYYILT